MNVQTINIQSVAEAEKTDLLINRITRAVVDRVPDVREFHVMTACVIDGEFVCVSEYDLPEGYFEKLEEVAKSIRL